MVVLGYIYRAKVNTVLLVAFSSVKGDNVMLLLNLNLSPVSG